MAYIIPEYKANGNINSQENTEKPTALTYSSALVTQYECFL